MTGTAIAAEIAAALAEAGEAVGTGPLVCTIRRASAEPDEPQNPWDEPADPVNAPTDYAVTAVEDVQDIRDMSGTLVGIQKRTLTVSATGVAPLKSDTIAVGVAPSAVTADTAFEQILAVKPLAPSGVALLYELELSA
jgi:hypothetical protein